MNNEQKMINIWQDFSNIVRLFLAEKKHGEFNLKLNIYDGCISCDYKIISKENRKMK